MKLNNKKGFTLIELLVVLAILVVLIAVAVPSVMGYRQKAEDSKNKANAKQVYTAIQAFNVDKDVDKYFEAKDTAAADNFKDLESFLGASRKSLELECTVKLDSSNYTVTCDGQEYDGTK